MKYSNIRGSPVLGVNKTRHPGRPTDRTLSPDTLYITLLQSLNGDLRGRTPVVIGKGDNRQVIVLV